MSALHSMDTTEIDINKLTSKLQESAFQTVNFFESKLQDDGSYGEEIEDICCYFKSPMMFIAANKMENATKILNHIKKRFMTKDGDFKTNDILKSKNPAYIEYWAYPNGWIVRAANQLNIEEISQGGYNYLKQYYLGDKLGFATQQITKEPKITDVLTIAHHGLINLEMNHLDIANQAGYFLTEALHKQPDLKKGFYLRFDNQAKVITQFLPEQAPFYYVNTAEPNQLYFMIGYPAAYLAILYQKTKNKDFLNAAKAYMDFALSCKDIYTCDFSHKIAWAASLLYGCTKDPKYLLVVNKITDYFIQKQQNGIWFTEDINTSYDQSAELACWFLEIVRNIRV